MNSASTRKNRRSIARGLMVLCWNSLLRSLLFTGGALEAPIRGVPLSSPERSTLNGGGGGVIEVIAMYS